MFVVPISFGVWLTIIVVGFAVLSLVMLPSWLEQWGRRTFTKPKPKPSRPSNLERHPGIYGKDHH